MAERRRQIEDQGVKKEGVVVDVKSSTSSPIHVELDDGTVLRIQVSVLEALRIEGEWTPNGDPSYVLGLSAVIKSESPENLRKGSNVQ